MPLVEPLVSCRSCHSALLNPVFDLGAMPISDFPADEQEISTAPLCVVLCADCGLSQLSHTVDREALFGRHYWYRSGVQPAMVDALRDVVTDALARRPLRPGDRALDIGANDGTLLSLLPDGVEKIAYEPAGNLWPDLHRKGIHVAGGLFPTMIAGVPAAVEGPVQLITSIAMFYSVADPDAFVESIARSLAPDGLWVNQMAYLPATLATNNVGDLCHEHLTYWTTHDFHQLLDRHGLRIEHAEPNGVNGGSMRTFIRHGRSTRAYAIDMVGALDWLNFAVHNNRNKTSLRTLLWALQDTQQPVYGYGASTKGNTMLAAWGIGPELIPAIADRNPEKWGRRTVTGIPIISEEEARAKADVFLILPFHFLDAFLEREAPFLARGGQFLVPLPTPRLVKGGEAHSSVRQKVPTPDARALAPS